MQNLLGILISSIGIGLALIAIVISVFFNRKANRLARELSRFIIKEISKEDVDPIFKHGKLIGKHIIKVVNETITIGGKYSKNS